MVTQVKAFAAEDGTVFATVQAAAEHDAREQLKKLGIFNEASLTAVITHAKAIYNALAVVVMNEEPSNA